MIRAELQPAERVAQPPAFLQPDQAAGGYPVVLENKLGGIDALVAELFQLPADGEAGAFLGEEEAHAPVARARPGVRLDEKREAGAVDAVGNPDLGAVHDIVAAIASRGRADGLQVGSAIRLGQRKSAADFAGGKPRQPGPLLFLRAEAQHGRGHDEMRVEDAGKRHPHGRDPLDDAGIGRGAEAEPAVFLGNDGAEKAELLHALDDVGGPGVAVFQRQYMGTHIAVEELVHRVEQRGFEFGGFELGGVGGGGVHGGDPFSRSGLAAESYRAGPALARRRLDGRRETGQCPPAGRVPAGEKPP